MQIPKLAIAALSAMALSMVSLSAQGGPIVLNGNFALTSAGTNATNGNFYGGTYGTNVTDWTLYPGPPTYTGGPLGLDIVASSDTNAAGGSTRVLGGSYSFADGSNTNFVAADGSCCNPVSGASNPTLGPLTQALALMGGQTYVLSFDYAAAQLSGASGATCAQWLVTIGGSVAGSPTSLTEPTNSSCPASTLNGGSTTNAYMVTGYLPGDEWSTPLLSVPSQSFSGWYTETVTFTVPGSGPTNELLGFFAEGSPIGGPPLDLLDNVSVVATPEPATYTLIGAGMLGVFAVRKRLKKRR